MPKLSTEEFVRDLRARRVTVPRGGDNVYEYEIADEVCEQAAGLIEQHFSANKIASAGAAALSQIMESKLDPRIRRRL